MRTWESKYLTREMLAAANILYVSEGRERDVAPDALAILQDNAIHYEAWPESFLYRKEQGEVEVEVRVVLDWQRRRYAWLVIPLDAFNALPEMVVQR